MIELYDYQKKYIDQLRQSMAKGNKKIVLCAPTGSGKTVMFTYMVSEHIKRGGNVIVFTHRSELLLQSGGTFEKFGLSPEMITASSKPDLDKNLHVAMVETFHRRMADYELILARKTLVIFDEAHLNNFNKIMPFIGQKQFVIGATATPYRKPKETQMCDFYHDIVQVVDTPDVIELGNLCKAVSYGVKIDLSGLKKQGEDYNTAEYYSENKLYSGVIDNWKKYSLNLKTILFASNINSSKEVCSEFVKNGFDAKHIDGHTSENERREIMQWFKHTDNAILCNCGVLTAGFDQPDIMTVILYRATTSLPLFLQMCGRGSRTYNGKTHFNILDFGNNIERLGFWQERRLWKLKYEKKADKEGVQPQKDCPDCGSKQPASAKECPECGHVFKKKEKTPEEVELQLLEYTASGKYVSQISVKDLVALQNMKRFKAPFIWRVIRSRGEQTLQYYTKLMGYNYGWYSRQLDQMHDSDFKDFIIKI
jgi:superfamily II DNA or RNA helicase